MYSVIIDRIKFMYKYLVLIFFVTVALAKAQSDSSANTILIKDKTKTPWEIIKDNSKDTTNNQSKLQSSEDLFSPDQDSAFAKAMNRNISFSVHLNSGLEYSNDLWLLQKELSKGTPWQVALDNIRNIPKEFYIPSGVEMVHREIALQNSQYIPFVRTMPQFGKFNISQILSFFGMVEDISPEITYSIDFVAEVEVVVYSVSSSVVATLFSGRQAPGKYTLTWNGRNSQGMMMPPGDYIGEVRIGNDRYIRKRIRIN